VGLVSLSNVSVESLSKRWGVAQWTGLLVAEAHCDAVGTWFATVGTWDSAKEDSEELFGWTKADVSTPESSLVSGIWVMVFVAWGEWHCDYESSMTHGQSQLHDGDAPLGCGCWDHQLQCYLQCDDGGHLIGSC